MHAVLLKRGVARKWDRTESFKQGEFNTLMPVTSPRQHARLRGRPVGNTGDAFGGWEYGDKAGRMLHSSQLEMDTYTVMPYAALPLQERLGPG